MNQDSLFREALAKPSGERQAFLDQACSGNPELRAGVDALLARHQESEAEKSAVPENDFVENLLAANIISQQLAGNPMQSDQGPTVDLPIGDAVEGIVIAGRYTLLKKIGEGGMGEVWVAKQTQPVKRNVALKLIKEGMDTKLVLARFEQERQALALMDHPNIARVLDGGMTADRRPFFVMELVNGLPLTQFCDEGKLGVRERLQLFIPICQAVQHAHQKGIVHRDLKPSNILITIIDGRPIPKVIDFGVAKATGGKLTDETMATQFGVVIGTLEYMSPEQAGFSGADIDTRSDIYSLGVILYELLTGRRPFQNSELKKAAFDEMIRMIREVEPSKPSARLSTDNALPSLAAIRRTEPRQLTNLLKGDLDWVIMKCLEKQRDRRYESASALAREVERYLGDEAVEARPPSAGYRLRKFVKRNKGRVLAAALLVLALIGGMIGTTYGLLRAEEQRQRAIEEQQKAEKARDEEHKARADAVSAAQSEKDAKLKAQSEQQKAEKAQATTAEQRQLALDTVRDVLLRVDDLMKNDVKLAPLRIEIIRRMMVDVDRIRDHAVKNPLEDRTEAVALTRIGEIYFKANRIQDAVEWFTKAYKILKVQADGSPKDPNALRNLAMISNQLGDAHWRLGNGMRSRELHADALRLHKACRPMLDKPQQEMERTDVALEIANSYRLVAYDDLRLGDPEKAVENNLIADAGYAALPSPLNNFLMVRRWRSELQVRLGDARSRFGEIELAHKHYLAALEDRMQLDRQGLRPSSTTTLIKTDVGQSYMYLGDYFLMARHDPASAWIEYGRAQRLFEKLLKEDPDNLDLRQRVASGWYRIGMTAPK